MLNTIDRAICDYSLTHIASRAAKVGDKLITQRFGSSGGFASVEDPNVAVCVLPGTEIAFDRPVSRAVLNVGYNGGYYPQFDGCEPVKLKSAVGVFRQVDKDIERVHHDALELAEDHDTVLLNHLIPGQTATVLQLPAAPKTDAEADAQRRVPVVA